MAKKVKRKQKKTKTFYVPITVTISGHETVRAKDKKSAIEKAKKQYWDRERYVYGHGVQDRCIDIDFAEYEDEVETDDEQE